MPVRLCGTENEWPLPDGVTFLGRGSTCQIRVQDPRLSRQHARFTVSGDTATIEDLGSANGILLNGDRLTGLRSLADGDLLVIGPLALNLVIGAAAHTITAGAAASTTDSGTDSEAPARKNTSSFALKPDTDRQAVHRSSALSPHAPPPPAAPAPAPEATATDDGEGDGSRSYAPAQLAASVVSDLARTRLLDEQPDNAALTVSRRPDSNSAASRYRPPRASTGGDGPDDAKPPTTGVLRPDKADTAPTRALVPNRASLRRKYQAIALARWLAGLLDLGQTAIVTTLVCAPLLAGGWLWALHQTKAGVDQGRASISTTATPASWGQLAGTLRNVRGWTDIPVTGLALRNRDHQAFLILFVSVTLTTLAGVLVPLFTLVAPTMLKGGPLWHRIFGLVIRDSDNGFYLPASRAAARWGLLALLAPAAPFCILLGLPSPHDLLVGARVEKR